MKSIIIVTTVLLISLSLLLEAAENAYNPANQSKDTMIQLPKDIGIMADRIGEMANRIGSMADKILETQRIQSDNFNKMIEANLMVMDMMNEQMKANNEFMKIIAKTMMGKAK